VFAKLASAICQASAVSGVAAVASDDGDTALIAGLTYGGLMAILKAITTIVKVIREARERRRNNG